MAVLSALFTSKDEDELIRIAKTEKEPLLRQRARMQLRLLATPKALKFLEENPVAQLAVRESAVRVAEPRTVPTAPN